MAPSSREPAGKEPDFQHLQAEIAEGRRHTGEVGDGLRAAMVENRRHTGEVGEGLPAEVAETRRHSDELGVGLRAAMAEIRADLRRHFEVVAEGLRQDLQLVADGVATNSERIDRLSREMRGELKVESEEAHSRIRLAYAELDRRLRHLEADGPALASRRGAAVPAAAGRRAAPPSGMRRNDDSGELISGRASSSTASRSPGISVTSSDFQS
jgi:hypothetical protein